MLHKYRVLVHTTMGGHLMFKVKMEYLQRRGAKGKVTWGAAEYMPRLLKGKEEELEYDPTRIVPRR